MSPVRIRSSTLVRGRLTLYFLPGALGELSMHADFRPKLRGFLQKIRDPADTRHGYLIDALRQYPEPLRLPIAEFLWLDLFDGQRTLRDIHASAKGQVGQRTPPFEHLLQLAHRLDQALFLEGRRWQDHAYGSVREPVCIGCYEGDPTALRAQIEDLFTRPGGPGLPDREKLDGRLRAAIVPHIDYGRGGVSYSWGFKEIFENTAASLFVIVGTSHYSTHRFSLTRKDFKTPLGITPTDQDFIDGLVRHYGDGLFDDELQAHLPEHSIELEVVLLQWYYARRRPIRIVPLVVGSFHDATLTGERPTEFDDVSRMIKALQRTLAETTEQVCVIISGDLAHIGPKFRSGRGPVTTTELARSRSQDQALLRCLETRDLDGYFQILVGEQDARAICGFPPTWTVLSALPASSGKVLHYGRFVHPTGFESVSFASVGLYA
jgi:MEMO1 family protein